MIEVRRTVATANRPDQPQRSRRARPERPCPCCGQPAGFCDTHRQRLQAIRAEMSGKGQYHNTSMVRGYRKPECCTPDCDNPRARGAQFGQTCMEESE